MKKNILIATVSALLLAAVGLVCFFLFKEEPFTEPVPAEPSGMNVFVMDDRSMFVMGKAPLVVVNAETDGTVSEYMKLHFYKMPKDILLQTVSEATLNDLSVALSYFTEGTLTRVFVPSEQAENEALTALLSQYGLTDAVVPVKYHDSFDSADISFYRSNKKGDVMSLVFLHGEERILYAGDVVKSNDSYTCALIPQQFCGKSKFTASYLICGSNRSDEVVILNNDLAENEPFTSGITSILSVGGEFYVFEEN